MTQSEFLLYVIAPGAVLWYLLTHFLSKSSNKRDTRILNDFAGLLDDGEVIGQPDVAQRAIGVWKGFAVEIGFFGRLEPAVFLTSVKVRRRSSPFAGLLLPRSIRKEKYKQPTLEGVPEWILTLDKEYDADCEPKELFQIFVDEEVATTLLNLKNTEIEILPEYVNIQLRKYSQNRLELIPLLDATILIVKRLEILYEQIHGPTKKSSEDRYKMAFEFLSRFK
ncbi:hypothetical protein EHO59_00070 [Leptospira semungkisensis]|uniref:Uncharacterized protein n=1 Tax=Leptospira semungkisensis TaxID=2484985 RepID=A0A4R9G719_9LEPT|nr:hypothetical protein [Leptospira semungkisensis]TGK06577.1 hypothetical protein EHO59_00070 [Leptospira semungkisensis]